MATAMLNVELCGRLADAQGREVTLAVPAAGLTVADLFAALGTAYPRLAAALASGRVRACVNEVIVPATVKVQAGDVVALFPPVSGG